MNLFPALFRTITIGKHRLKNRLVGLPVYSGYAHPGGWVSALLIKHYTQLSMSGVAMVVVANAAVSEDGIISNFNLRIDQDDFIPGLSKLAKAIKSSGALACLQINHAGRFAKTEKPLLPHALDSSNLSFNVAALRDFMNFFPFEKRFRLTHRFLKSATAWNKAMTAEERKQTIDDFSSAALRAWKAGFDMIELHGAGGYLLCQFLSSFTNKIRPDFNLELKDRTGFPLAVIREIKKRLPDKFPIGYRLTVKEWVPEGIDLPEAIAFAKLLEKEKIAYISVSAGSYSSMFSPKVQKIIAEPGYLKKDTEIISTHVSLPTIVSGRVIDPDLADQIAKNNPKFLMGLGRPLRADPKWVIKAKKQGRKIKTCINCNWCLKRVILDEGFNCRRWPRLIQEKTDLELKLLSRNYKGLFVAANTEDLKTLQKILPKILPDRRNVEMTISPTFMILRRQGKDEDFDSVTADFFKEAKTIINQCGFTDALPGKIIRIADTSFDQEVHAQVKKGNHGLIIIPRNKNEPWRSKLAFKERGKIIIYIGNHFQMSELLVPVDMSINTLLTMMFLKQTFLNKDGLNLHFVHVLSGSARLIEQRWLKIKKIVNFDRNVQLQLIKSTGDAAEDLLNLLTPKRFDTIIMGRRGVSRIKRLLLGSVSAKLLREITDETLFIID